MNTEYVVLYRHNTCGKLSASKIIINSNGKSITNSMLDTQTKHIRKYCTRCREFITAKHFIYNTPKYCLKSEAYNILLRDCNLY